MSAICDKHDCEYLPSLGCAECLNEECIPRRLARRVATTMPPTALDAMAEAVSARFANEGEAKVRWELLVARLEEDAKARIEKEDSE